MNAPVLRFHGETFTDLRSLPEAGKREVIWQAERASGRKAVDRLAAHLKSEKE